MLETFWPLAKIIIMKNNFYRELWFSLRGLERLLGVNRNSIAYRIRRLQDYGAINPVSCKEIIFRHQEGRRDVVRKIKVVNIFAARAVAETYDTVRARSVVERCTDIIRWNNDADYSDVRSRIVD